MCQTFEFHFHLVFVKLALFHVYLYSWQLSYSFTENKKHSAIFHTAQCSIISRQLLLQ